MSRTEQENGLLNLEKRAAKKYLDKKVYYNIKFGVRKGKDFSKKGGKLHTTSMYMNGRKIPIGISGRDYGAFLKELQKIINKSKKTNKVKDDNNED